MTLWHGVGARLSLALALVVAAALGIVYVIVVPSLEGRLVDSKQSTLRSALPGVVASLPSDQFDWPDYVDAASFRAGARVVVYAVDSVMPTAYRVVADSRAATSRDVSSDAVVEKAIVGGRLVTGDVSRDEGSFAEAAFPVDGRRVAVMLQLPLSDALANIRLVERRLVLAGVIALIVAIAIGFGGASAFGRRIRRLERAAGRIADGRFDEPIEDGGRDEVGALAVAFDRMRVRLRGLDDARREFIANASHELRTPIFALSGSLELLAEEEMDPATQREFIESMQGQMERLSRLASELLDLSRLDAGKLRLEAEDVDLGESASEVSGEFQAVATLSGHRLGVVAGSAEAEADGERVLQIVRGLVENAIRHTPAGSSIQLGAEVAGGFATLWVEDDGPGIAAEHRGRVFERFYRADGGRASGSGLGLAIGSELARLMGGRLELDSIPGRTRFTLVLPVAAALDDNA